MGGVVSNYLRYKDWMFCGYFEVSYKERNSLVFFFLMKYNFDFFVCDEWRRLVDLGEISIFFYFSICVFRYKIFVKWRKVVLRSVIKFFKYRGWFMEARFFLGSLFFLSVYFWVLWRYGVFFVVFSMFRWN